MKPNKAEEKFKTHPLGVLHETMKGLHDIGLISAEKMEKFDKGCLASTAASKPKRVKAS